MDIGAETIDKWHKERGWAKIGYHWVVRRSGAVEQGRSEREIGSHCQGHNATSIGVVWVGRDTPAPEQYRALVTTIRAIQARHQLPVGAIYGHRDFSTKTCPNIDMAALRAAVESAAPTVS